ncbi:MAG: Flp family type IVb pilin [Robiginitomaculum sp.]
MQNFITRFVKDESGATAIEYGLIAALIAVAIIASATKVGEAINGIFNKTSKSLEDAAGTAAPAATGS